MATCGGALAGSLGLLQAAVNASVKTEANAMLEAQDAGVKMRMARLVTAGAALAQHPWASDRVIACQ
ncbi:MAG: hypothetical protein RL701_1063 [Pseudomonadota bacterium]